MLNGKFGDLYVSYKDRDELFYRMTESPSSSCDI
jgi:hypothetical protein